MNVPTMQRLAFADLIEFVTVAERRSFRRAAAQLGVSAPTLSHTIRAVEDRLGVRLLNRTTRHVAPTPAGERLLARLRPVMDELQSALEEMNDYRQRPAGSLRLAVAPAACHLMGPILARFAAQYPDIKIEITADDRAADVVSSHCEAGIALREHVTDTMVAVPAGGAIRRIVVGAPSYFQQHGIPRTPEELSQHHCIRFRTPSRGIEPWPFARGDEIFTVPVDGAIVVDDVELGLRTALSGGGLVHVPESCAQAAIESCALQATLQAWMPKPSDGFVLYYPNQRHNPKALRCLVEFLREYRRSERLGTTFANA